MNAIKIVASAFVAMCIVSCGGGGDSSPATDAFGPVGDPNFSIITYTVRGSAASAQITYRTSSGGTSQVTAPLPWSYFSTFNKGDVLYVSAQNQGSSGTVMAEITGSVGTLSYASSSSAYGIATASKSCCK